MTRKCERGSINSSVSAERGEKQLRARNGAPTCDVRTGDGGDNTQAPYCEHPMSKQVQMCSPKVTTPIVTSLAIVTKS